MKKFVILLLVVFFSTFFYSCGKKQVKKPSSEYLYATEAFKVVNEIRIAYQNRDNSGIRKNSTEQGYRDIIASIRPFDTAELEFTPVLLEMEGEFVRLYVSWNGKWRYLNSETEERGLASFLLKGNPPKVDRILRGNPFRYPD